MREPSAAVPSKKQRRFCLLATCHQNLLPSPGFPVVNIFSCGGVDRGNASVYFWRVKELFPSARRQAGFGWFSLLIVLTTVFLVVQIYPSVAAPGDGHWDRQFNMPGTASINYALKFHGERLYTGGIMAGPGGNFATNSDVNIFDGTNWSRVEGITGGSGTTLIEDVQFLGSNMYVGGIFSKAGGLPAVGLAKWDGTKWSDVGGFAGAVMVLTTDGTNLYVGGTFTNAGGVAITNVAKWDGTNWSALGGGLGYYSGSLFPSVNVLVWREGQLYAGGSFTNAGAVAATNLAVWNGSTWSQVGGGVAGTGSILTGAPVAALKFLGPDLYVGGNFTAVGNNVAALNVARWNGTTWSALGTGLKAPPNSSSVNALAVLGSDLYATGNFTNAGGTTATRVAKWDGGSWYSIGPLNGSAIRAVSNSGSIYICGNFNLADYDSSNPVIGNHIIRWDGANWHGVPGPPANGTHSFVQALGLGDDGLYMGGLFIAAGATPASRIARWDGTNWHALGSGVSGSYGGNTVAVRAIRTWNNEVYVGGAFVSAGGWTANNVAAWYLGNWYTLAYGVDSTVAAILPTADDVYVGGSFTNATDVFGPWTVNRIARYEKSSGYWWWLGSGVSGGSVNCLAMQDGLLYAGGTFTNAGGGAANRIAVWDGANWSSLGAGAANGLGGTVNTILVDGTDIYVGGSFTTAGGATARALAQWNGSSWSAVGGGMFASGTASVSGLARIGGYLYATGNFTNAGGSLITRGVARWDGIKWEALGSGIGNNLSAGRGTVLASWGNDLFVGGIFEDAGGGDAGYIARWNDQLDFTPPSTMRLFHPQMLPGNAFKFRVTATERASYVIEHSADLTSWTPFLTNGLSPLEVTNTAPGANVRTFRMRQVP